MRRRSGTAPFQLFSFQDIITSVMGIVVLILLVLALELSQRQLTAPAAVHASARRDTAATLAEVQQEINRLRSQLNGAAPGDLAALSSEEVASRVIDAVQTIERLKQESMQARRRVAVLHARYRTEQRDLAAQSKAANSEQKERELKEVQRKLEQWRGKKRIVYRTAANDGKQPWLVELAGDAFQVAPVGKAAPPIRFVQPDSDDRQTALLAWCQGLSPARDSIHLLIKPGAADIFDEVQEALRRRGFSLGIDLLSADQVAIDPETGAGIPANPSPSTPE
jgi:hypothetical protein